MVGGRWWEHSGGEGASPVVRCVGFITMLGMTMTLTCDDGDTMMIIHDPDM